MLHKLCLCPGPLCGFAAALARDDDEEFVVGGPQMDAQRGGSSWRSSAAGRHGVGEPGGPSGPSGVPLSPVRTKQSDGKVVYRDGRTYEGQMLGAMRHGRGKEVSPDGGFVYTGEFSYDQYSGHGDMQWRSGARYVGQFVDDMKHGMGTEIYATGAKYRGEFRFNRVHGKGEMWEPNSKNKTSVRGWFEAGKFHKHTESFLADSGADIGGADGWFAGA